MSVPFLEVLYGVQNQLLKNDIVGRQSYFGVDS